MPPMVCAHYTSGQSPVSPLEPQNGPGSQLSGPERTKRAWWSTNRFRFGKRRRLGALHKKSETWIARPSLPPPGEGGTSRKGGRMRELHFREVRSLTPSLRDDPSSGGRGPARQDSPTSCESCLFNVKPRESSISRNPTRGHFLLRETCDLRRIETPQSSCYRIQTLLNEYFIGRYGPIAHAVIWPSGPNTGERKHRATTPSRFTRDRDLRSAAKLSTDPASRSQISRGTRHSVRWGLAQYWEGP